MNKLNSTTLTDTMQDTIYNLTSKIEKHLQTSLDDSAKSFGAIIRKREIQSAAGLLKLLLIYATSRMTFQILALCCSTLNIASVSDTALRKKMINSLPWLTYILKSLLSTCITNRRSNDLNVLLLDGSSVKITGKDGVSCRIHTCFNLNKGVVQELKITDHHTAESLEHFNIGDGDIAIADRGFCRASQYLYAISKGADVIIRFIPSNFNLYDKHGNQINLFDVLKGAKKPVLELNCFVKNGKKLVPIRIIASQLPEDKIEPALKRKKRQQQKSQTKMRPETLEYAKWVILATSLDKSFTQEDVLSLYRSRWQIELLFKRIKQNLGITKMRKSSTKHAFALITLWLIIWTITERQALAMEKLLIEKGQDKTLISPWRLCQFCCARIISIIETSWTTLVDLTDHETLARCLLNHKNERIPQYCTYHLDISTIIPA